PKLVKVLTSLITLIFPAASKPSSFKSNAVFSATFTSPPSPPPPPLGAPLGKPRTSIPGIISIMIGSSLTPRFSRITSTRSITSSNVSPITSSTIADTFSEVCDCDATQ
ncbi:hypothetical protein V8G54_004659, partial [Vigna mungo]